MSYDTDNNDLVSFDYSYGLRIIRDDYNSGDFIFSEDYRRILIANKYYFIVFPSFVGSLTHEDCSLDKKINDLKDRAYSIENTNICDNTNFTTPCFSQLIVDSSVFKDLGNAHSLILPCPDRIAPHIVSILENIYNLLEKYREDDGLDFSLEEVLNTKTIILGDGSLSDIFSYKRAMKSIENSFPKSKTGTLRRLFSDAMKSFGIAKSLIILSNFILINELINHYINTGENLSITDIFPSTRTFRLHNHNRDGQTHVSHPDFNDFYYKCYEIFNNLDFKYNDYTDKIASFVFALNFNKKRPGKEFTLEDVYHFHLHTDGIVYFKATDYINMSDKLVYDKNSKIFVNSKKFTNIDDDISPLFNSSIIDYYNNKDFKTKTTGKFSLVHNEERLKKEYTTLALFILFYKNYVSRISRVYNDDISHTMKNDFIKTYILVYKSAVEENKNRNLRETIVLEEIMLTAFFVNQVNFYCSIDEINIDNNEKESQRILSYTNIILEDKSFFDMLTIHHIMQLVKTHLDKPEIPLNLIRLIVSPQ